MRAIILAAGMGTRLKPLTDNIPKSLVKVCEEPMAERQVRFLKEKGINDIIIVVGYMKEKFQYLEEKYGVKLIYNDKYDVYNNVYTMYLVRDYIKDCYITEADVYMVENFFQSKIDTSTYFIGMKENFEKEWIPKFDYKGNVNGIEVGPGSGYIMSGISYWSERDGKIIKDELETVIKAGNFDNVYWDDVIAKIISKLHVKVQKTRLHSWFEIDSIKDLNKAETIIKTLKR
ncbi:lic-1 operon protein [Clostridium putrefaciens]|uniref:Lic-1 operon protein n=1 Tax=Clostridium putrefaciens TaxID=99675 RepID=A0A381J4I9_9CLOT|nr:sugar phosphate nucleotidyltransferase [Clostridium putrefaciens]SUY45173.1 lic-1 operon protein [Clostridium putrefaciens]